MNGPWRVRPRIAIGLAFAQIDDLAGKMLEPDVSRSTVGQAARSSGLTGLIGSGYEEVPYLVFGARTGRSGRIKIGDMVHVARCSSPRSPRASATALGLALLPADRQGASGVDSLSIVDNLFLPDVSRFFKNWSFMQNGCTWCARRVRSASVSRYGRTDPAT